MLVNVQIQNAYSINLSVCQHLEQQCFLIHATRSENIIECWFPFFNAKFDLFDSYINNCSLRIVILCFSCSAHFQREKWIKRRWFKLILFLLFKHWTNERTVILTFSFAVFVFSFAFSVYLTVSACVCVSVNVCVECMFVCVTCGSVCCVCVSLLTSWKMQQTEGVYTTADKFFIFFRFDTGARKENEAQRQSTFRDRGWKQTRGKKPKSTVVLECSIFKFEFRTVCKWVSGSLTRPCWKLVLIPFWGLKIISRVGKWVSTLLKTSFSHLYVSSMAGVLYFFYMWCTFFSIIIEYLSFAILSRDWTK